jgi:hypothetical protein
LKIEVSQFLFRDSPSCNRPEFYSNNISEDGTTFVQYLESLYCARDVNFPNENRAFTYFNLKLDITVSKTGGFISPANNGVIT